MKGFNVIVFPFNSPLLPPLPFPLCFHVITLSLFVMLLLNTSAEKEEGRGFDESKWKEEVESRRILLFLAPLFARDLCVWERVEKSVIHK